MEGQAASKVLTARAAAFLDSPVNAAIVQGADGVQVSEAQEGKS